MNSRQQYLQQMNIYIVQEEARELQKDSSKWGCWAVQQQRRFAATNAKYNTEGNRLLMEGLC